MFKYGIDTFSFTVIFVIAAVVGIFAIFVFRTAFVDDFCSSRVKFKKSVGIFLISFTIIFIFGFYPVQKDYYCGQSVKAILHENYLGYKEFKDKNYGDDGENSFIYKKAKYTWEYDKSNKKLTITYYGVPHKDSTFVNDKKVE